jgi:hypothetical protein
MWISTRVELEVELHHGASHEHPHRQWRERVVAIAVW